MTPSVSNREGGAGQADHNGRHHPGAPYVSSHVSLPGVRGGGRRVNPTFAPPRTPTIFAKMPAAKRGRHILRGSDGPDRFLALSPWLAEDRQHILLGRDLTAA